MALITYHQTLITFIPFYSVTNAQKMTKRSIVVGEKNN